MTNYRSLFLILGLFVAAPALCAPTPKSYIDGNPQTKSDTHLYPVHIVAVDGDAAHTIPVAVTPGPHWLEIEAPTTDAAGSKGASRSQTFVLKIEPCTYYYVGAHKDSATPDKWNLVVDAEDTLKECDPAAELKQARDVPPAQPSVVPKSHAPQ